VDAGDLRHERLAGENVVLWFNDHDDGYATDPTYFLLDDVAVG
jgi:hypothetical protein